MHKNNKPLIIRNGIFILYGLYKVQMHDVLVILVSTVVSRESMAPLEGSPAALEACV